MDKSSWKRDLQSIEFRNKITGKTYPHVSYKILLHSTSRNVLSYFLDYEIHSSLNIWQKSSGKLK